MTEVGVQFTLSDDNECDRPTEWQVYATFRVRPDETPELVKAELTGLKVACAGFELDTANFFHASRMLFPKDFTAALQHVLNAAGECGPRVRDRQLEVFLYSLVRDEWERIDEDQASRRLLGAEYEFAS